MLAKLTSVCYITRYANGKNKTTNRELRQIPAGIRTCCHTQKGLRRLLTFSMASTITDLALSCGYMSREGAGVTLKGTFYQQFHCKSDDTPGVNMALNFFLSHDKKAGNTLILRKASSIKNPTNRMILCEVMTSFGAPTDYNHPKMRYSHHGGCAQYLMLDGHVMQNSYRNWSVTFGNDETRPKYLECWYYY